MVFSTAQTTFNRRPESQGIIRILASRSTQPKTGRPPPIRGKIHRKNIGRDFVELVRKNAMMMLS